MAREIIINQEFWESGKVARLSIDARLLYLGMWAFANDYNMISESKTELISNVFGKNETVTIDKIAELIIELTENDFIDFVIDEQSTELFIRLLPVGLIYARPSIKFWKETRKRIFTRDNFVCQYCGSTNRRLECDHVMPISRGGSNYDNNLVAACYKCNAEKHNKTAEEWKSNGN